MKVGDLVKLNYKSIGYTSDEHVMNLGLVIANDDDRIPFGDLIHIFWSDWTFTYTHESALILLNGENNE